MVRILFKVLVIGAACFVTAAKVRQGGACPLATTQELNRCLALVRAASVRATPVHARRRQAFSMHDR